MEWMNLVKINNLEIENVKRVKAVRIEPSKAGLTIIGGKNGQGKTSVLDAIAWALGGNKMQPSQAMRDGSVVPPKIHIELSNGLIVERDGKNSTLKVLDPSGQKAGQKLLDSFIEQLALNLPKFMESSSAEKGKTLLQIIGVGDQLAKLDDAEQKLYNRRTEIGRIADQKKKYAAEMTFYEGVPKEPVSASKLIRQQQEILARNGENQRLRVNVESVKRRNLELKSKYEELQKELNHMGMLVKASEIDLVTAEKSALDLHDESTEELEKNINDIDALNIKIRANLDREKAEIDAEGYGKQYDSMTEKIRDVRDKRTALLAKADLPLPGLTVKDGNLIYNNQQWDCMSSAEQLKVATAIVRKLNPECGFVLMDKLEQMDIDTLQAFGAWLEKEGLQAIATRVSTSGECSLIIEDGYVKGVDLPLAPQETDTKTWKAGEF
jgi:hypothetical protein